MFSTCVIFFFFFFQAEDGIRDVAVTGVQTCALPIYRADPHSDGGPPLPHHVRGDLRAGAVAVRVSRGPVDRDPAPRGRDVAVRAHRRDLRAGPARGHRGPERVAVRRRQLLRERQADRRRRGAAAVRRGARQRHRRQGGKPAQPDPLVQPPGGEGNLRPAAELLLPVHGRVVSRGGARPHILALVMGGAFALLVVSLLVGPLPQPALPPYTPTAL